MRRGRDGVADLEGGDAVEQRAKGRVQKRTRLPMVAPLGSRKSGGLRGRCRRRPSRKQAERKTKKETMRALKRRISDAVCNRLLADARS